MSAPTRQRETHERDDDRDTGALLAYGRNGNPVYEDEFTVVWRLLTGLPYKIKPTRSYLPDEQEK